MIEKNRLSHPLRPLPPATMMICLFRIILARFPFMLP